LNIVPLPLVKSEEAVEAWWDLSPKRERPEGWVQALEGARTLPLYLKDPNSFYWYEYMPRTGIMYIQYNRSADMKSESTKAFGERLLKAFDQHNVKAVVLDLRFNTGGNLTLAKDLMERLQKRTKGIPRFAITGRATFSAGISQAASWRQAGNTLIAGEPVGDDLDFWAEGGNIRLPNSGYDAHFANGPHSYSEAPCPGASKCVDFSVKSLRPDLPARPSWEEYRAGRDPAMDLIEKHLSVRR